MDLQKKNQRVTFVDADKNVEWTVSSHLVKHLNAD